MDRAFKDKGISRVYYDKFFTYDPEDKKLKELAIIYRKKSDVPGLLLGVTTTQAVETTNWNKIKRFLGK